MSKMLNKSPSKKPTVSAFNTVNFSEDSAYVMETLRNAINVLSKRINDKKCAAVHESLITLNHRLMTSITAIQALAAKLDSLGITGLSGCSDEVNKNLFPTKEK